MTWSMVLKMNVVLTVGRSEKIVVTGCMPVPGEIPYWQTLMAMKEDRLEMLERRL
jgi:hypothetical protein